MFDLLAAEEFKACLFYAGLIGTAFGFCLGLIIGRMERR
jgi:hypothetical protein